MKGNLKEYRNILTGVIRYEPPTQDLSSFKGSLRLKKDPIPEEISINNLCLKDSTLHYCDWVIGMIIYCGNDIKENLPINNGFNEIFRTNFYGKFLNKFNIVVLVVVIFECFICKLQIDSKSLAKNAYEDNINEILGLHLIVMIPGNVSMIVDFFFLLQKIILEKSCGKNKLLILEPSKLSFMNQITDVFLDLSLVISPGKAKISSFYIPNEKKNFFLMSKNFNESLHDSTKIKILPISEPRKTEFNIKINESIIEPLEVENNKINDKSEAKLMTVYKEKEDFSISNEGNISSLPEELPHKFQIKKNEIGSQEVNEMKGSTNIFSFESEPLNYQKDRGNRERSLDTLIKKSVEIYSPNKKYATLAEISDFEIMGDFEHFKKSTKSGNELEKYHDLFEGLLLCHDIRFKEDFFSKFEKNYIYDYGLPDTEAILAFISDYGYKFESQTTILNKKIFCYNVSENEKKKQFYIVGKNFEKTGCNNKYYKFSIILKPAVLCNPDESEELSIERLKQENPILYIRTDDPFFLNNIDIDENEKELIRLKMDILRHKGMRFIIICQKKNLHVEELDDYIEFLKKPHTKEFKDIQVTFESKCELLTILGVQEELKEDVKCFISDFLTIDNKIWLFSNDHREKAFSVAYNLGVLKNEIENLALEIDSENFSVNEAWMKIRMGLNRLKKNIYSENNNESFLSSTNLLSRKSNTRVQINKSRILDNVFSKRRFTLSINGKMLELLKTNENLLDNFAFMAYFCKGLVGYEISPKDKSFWLV